MSRSIKARLTTAFALSVALLMAVVCGSLLFYARYSAERNAQSVLNAAAAKLAREHDEEMEPRDFARSAHEVLEDLPPDNLSVYLVGRDGRVLRSSLTTSPDRAPVNGREWRTVSAQSGENHLVVALPWAKTESSIRSLAESLVLLSLLVVMLVTAGAWMLVGRTLSPISKLSEQANAATTDNLQVRLDESSQDAEIVNLVTTLNGLLSRLSETASAKGRFYSAASHELRTPLQALSGHLELGLTRERSKEEYQATIQEAYRQTRRLVTLTRGLLMLYQLDSSSSNPPVEPVDLSAVCRDTLAQFQALAEQSGLRVQSDVPASAVFDAPATHAEILVRNLVENAVRYASPGGAVSLRVTADPAHLNLEVFNECAVPDDWNPDKLFEPFARTDQSRSSETGGTGLGLTLCKAIADANGWALDLHRSDIGVHAVVSIPADPSPARA